MSAPLTRPRRGVGAQPAKAGFLLVVALATSAVTMRAHAAGPKWQGTTPSIAREPAPWQELITELSKRGFYFGSLAASARVLLLFNDLPTKELAYRTVVSLVDRGYPYPVQPLFLPGDLTPADDYDFVNSYNLYKALLNRDKGMARWSQYYLENVDQENFPKFLFFQAIESYGRGDFKAAEAYLRKILGKELPASQLPLTRKVARTLARLLFEQEQYAKSHEIYATFLMRLNPITPSDWLEDAWNLYYLKRYTEALGQLYNLESRSAGVFENLEKYTIRALSYRSLCAVENAERLIDSFERDYGAIINALKRGEPVSRYPKLIRLDVAENQEFQALSITIAYLRGELGSLTALPRRVRTLATHLYKTELRSLTQRRKGTIDQALERAARKLIVMAEQLRFLKYDVQREKFNPDVVFRALAANKSELVEDLPGNQFLIRWNQYGDYWRDERQKYVAKLTNQCLQ